MASSEMAQNFSNTVSMTDWLDSVTSMSHHNTGPKYSKTFLIQDCLPPAHRCPSRTRDSESLIIVVGSPIGSPIPLVSITRNKKH